MGGPITTMAFNMSPKQMVSEIRLVNGCLLLCQRNLTEVLPTIDNPASPMRSFQADRLWMVDGSPDLEANYRKVRKYRSLGLEKVTIRYHEGFWRDAGESYTFRTNTAPGRGGNKVVRNFVRDKSKILTGGLACIPITQIFLLLMRIGIPTGF